MCQRQPFARRFFLLHLPRQRFINTAQQGASIQAVGQAQRARRVLSCLLQLSSSRVGRLVEPAQKQHHLLQGVGIKGCGQLNGLGLRQRKRRTVELALSSNKHFCQPPSSPPAQHSGPRRLARLALPC